MKPVFQGFARGVGIVVATVGEGELMLSGVDTGCDAFVEQGEADDTVLATTHNPTTHTLYLVTTDGEEAQTEGWQLDGLHLTDMACGIL